MKVLILGSGGREHALCYYIAKSKKVSKIFCIPGNAGTNKLAINYKLDLNDFKNLKKFNAEIVPVYIERLKNNDFKIEFYQPIIFSKKDEINKITLKLNSILETMILRNPEQWIWTHNRWK